jgi:importin-7
MEERVLQALLNCTQPDTETRVNSESFLESIKAESGFPVLLLRISINPVYPLQVRQLSSIYLKNQLKKWKDSCFSIEDKRFLKDNIIQCLKLSIPDEIRSQYEEISRIIGHQDKSWETLIPLIHTYLDSSDPDMIYASLSLLNQLSKEYEYIITEKRNNLKILTSSFLPKLEELLKKLLEEKTPSAYPYISFILQFYWVSFYVEASADHATERALNSWLDKFRAILLLEFDTNKPTSHFEAERRAKEPKMQCKKWASQILYRFFNRYHNYKSQIEINTLIGQVFNSNWVKPILDIIISQTFQYTQVFIPDTILNYYIKYINQAIKHIPSCEYLKTVQLPTSEYVIPALITQIITPVLLKTPNDHELWTENPIEYIRKEADFSYTFYSSSSAAIDLLVSICERGYLQQYLFYLNTSLSSNVEILTKEALIYQVGSISEILREQQNLAEQVQEMLKLYVFSELTNPIGFLRARACWAYGQFSAFPFSDPEDQKNVLEKICALVLDPELPVKYEAALTLPKILSWEVSKSRIRGEISNVLKIYLDLINEIDSEEIIEALEDIVTSYSQEVLPFAIELVVQLSGNFIKLALKDNPNEEDDSAMAAVSVLNTIEKIVETVSEKTEELFKISHIVLPLLKYSLSKEGSAYMEEGLNILSSLLYYSLDQSLPHLFELFTQVLHSLQESDPYGIEKTEEIFPVLANFIGKYSSLVNPVLEQVINFLLDLIKDDVSINILSCKVLIVIFERLRSSASVFLPQILPKVFSVVQSTSSHKTKTICCQVAYTALWADTEPSLLFMDQNKIFKPLFNYSLNSFKYIKEKISRVQVVLGIASLLPLIPKTPDSLSLENSVMIFKRLVEMTSLLEQDSEETNETSPFVDAEEFNENSEQIIKKIQDCISDSDEEEEVLYETDADEFYDSIFEKINYKLFLKNQISNTPTEIINHLISSIDNEQQEFLQKVLNNS